MTDEEISTAIGRPCQFCDAAPGTECETLDGQPYVELCGVPVHMDRGSK